MEVGGVPTYKHASKPKLESWIKFPSALLETGENQLGSILMGHKALPRERSGYLSQGLPYGRPLQDTA